MLKIILTYNFLIGLWIYHNQCQTEDLDIEVIEDESLIDEEELGKFLKRSLPRVLQAVIENETSQAFASNLRIFGWLVNCCRLWYHGEFASKW